MRLSVLKWDWPCANKESSWPLDGHGHGTQARAEVSCVNCYKIKGLKITIKASARTEGVKSDRNGNRSGVTGYWKIFVF